MKRATVATVWLDGCSGCHMSFLDMDERILDLATRFELVYSPLVDQKVFPESVDVTLVEGAVSSEEDLHKILLIRKKSKIVVALGDCAVTSNVPSMRNPIGSKAVLDRAYLENAEHKPHLPGSVIPTLLPQVRPVHEVIRVDAFVPGCPPSADTIYCAVRALLDGKPLDLNQNIRFG